MAGLADALRDPIALSPNRIPRFYRGGRLLAAFRGDATAADDDRPEDWVGSATRAWTPLGEAPTRLGLSEVRIGDASLSLDEVLAREPEALIGPALLERSGPTLGLLVKLLDAAERLPVHCHPTREAASRLLGSPFGKTEAWLIMGTRTDDARIWAGFREPVEPATLRRWIDEQSTDLLLGALVEHTVRPGDAFLVPAGTPHAIGAGVFLLELQEPTDFSVLLEYAAFGLDGGHLELGWDLALQCVDRSAWSPQQLAALRGDDTRLLPAEADPFFAATRLRGPVAALDAAFSVVVVVSGAGTLAGEHDRLVVRRGDTLLIPYAAGRLTLAGDLEAVRLSPARAG